MRLVGINETFDAHSEETTKERVFEFDTKIEDYMFRYHVIWEAVLSEYIIKVNRHRYHIPSGFYVLTGYIGGDTDWILIDELINSAVDVIQTNNEFNTVSLHPAKLVSLDETVVHVPKTKHPFPISDVTGQRCIMVATSDMYFKLKPLEISDYCAIG